MGPNHTKDSYGTIQEDTAEQGWSGGEPSTLQEHTSMVVSTKIFDLAAELHRLLSLAFPSVAVQFNMYILYPQAASEVGRVLGTVELAGFSLGCLVGNITCLSITVGVLAAADTLMPRAYGAGRYAEVGRLAVRAIVMAVIVLIPPVIPLCTILQPMLEFLGQDEQPARLAAAWVRWYLWSVPATLVLRTLQRFLVAQSLPWPPVYATTVPAFVIFPFLVRVLVAHMGFLGSAVAIAITQWLMVLSLLLYLRIRPVYKAETWPATIDLSFIGECVQCDKMMEFASLSLGGVMGLSEWWFWETMCFVAGSFGTVAFCAHTIAYNIIPLAFMLPLGLSIGTVVRIGQELPTNPQHASLIAKWSLILALISGTIVALGVYLSQDFVVGLFTTDPAVFKACRRIWPYVSVHLVVEYLFCLQSYVMRALAMQWRMALCLTACLWGLLLPTVFWQAVRNGGGLGTLWTLLPIGYAFTNVVMRFSYAYVDWNEKSLEARKKLQSLDTDFGRTEQASLLPQDSIESEASS
mmetsp:Transcript_10009/g.19245  ORF Transcript_10009/g.19245 Transcript_10009/m.19245 type:complete len:522 (-) Transcript_10009:369-1934(-)